MSSSTDPTASIPQAPREPTLSRLLIGRAFPPQLGGGIPIECYLDVRILGDAGTGQWEPFMLSCLEAFETRAEALGWLDDDAHSSRERIHVTGSSDVIGYLAKNTIGQLQALSAAKAVTFMSLSNVAGVDPDLFVGFAFAGTMPTAVADELRQMVGGFLSVRGVKIDDVSK